MDKREEKSVAEGTKGRFGGDKVGDLKSVSLRSETSSCSLYGCLTHQDKWPTLLDDLYKKTEETVHRVTECPWHRLVKHTPAITISVVIGQSFIWTPPSHLPDPRPLKTTNSSHTGPPIYTHTHWFTYPVLETQLIPTKPKSKHIYTHLISHSLFTLQALTPSLNSINPATSLFVLLSNVFEWNSWHDSLQTCGECDLISVIVCFF